MLAPLDFHLQVTTIPAKDRFRAQSLQNSCHLSGVNASVRYLSVRSCNELNTHLIFILVSSIFDNLQVTTYNASDFIYASGVTEISSLTFLQRLEKELFINQGDCSWTVKRRKQHCSATSVLASLTAAAGQPSFGWEGCLNHLPNKSKR